MKALLQHRDVWLIGGGGKTTLMYRLAREWAALGESSVCTTTTKIWPPTPEECADLRLGEAASILADLRARPALSVTAAKRLGPSKETAAIKCHGFTAEEALSLGAASRHLVVEADGSAGRPVKGHAAHEPVIASSASCVVAVVGGWCVGAPLDAEHVHRPEQFAKLAGRDLRAPVTAEDVARVILHEEGWLRAVPASARFYVVVTGEDRGIALALEAHPMRQRICGIERSRA